MEQLFIVLIDPEQRKIFLRGEYNRDFLLEEAHILQSFLKDKNVIYITQASEINSDELMENASEIMEQLPPREVPKRFYRVNIEGFTLIPEVRIRFAGPKDCKPVEQFSKNIFEKSSTMCKLLMSGKLEILSEEEVEKIKKPKHKDPEKSSVLLNQRVIDKDGNANLEGVIETIFSDNDKEIENIETDEEAAIRQGFGKK